MYYKGKKVDVSKFKQIEDKFSRFEYEKIRIDVASGLRGLDEKIKDSRW